MISIGMDYLKAALIFAVSANHLSLKGHNMQMWSKIRWFNNKINVEPKGVMWLQNEWDINVVKKALY